MRAKLVLAAALFIFLAFLVFSVWQVYADVVDDHFETARGELLGFYGSEIVAHTAILLGIIIALPSVFWNVWKRFNNRMQGSWRSFASYFVYFLVLFFIILLIFFTVGRIAYYSSLVSSLTSATRESLGVNVTESNLTSIAGDLSNYTQNAFWNSTGFARLGQWLYPSNDNLECGAIIVLVISVVAGAIRSRFRNRVILSGN